MFGSKPNQLSDEEEAEPEGVVHKDSPETTKVPKSHPQQVNKIPPDVDRACTFADGQVHLGWKYIIYYFDGFMKKYIEHCDGQLFTRPFKTVIPSILTTCQTTIRSFTIWLTALQKSHYIIIKNQI